MMQFLFYHCSITASEVEFPLLPWGVVVTVQMDIAHVQHILHVPALLGQPRDVLTQCPFGVCSFAV